MSLISPSCLIQYRTVALHGFGYFASLSVIETKPRAYFRRLGPVSNISTCVIDLVNPVQLFCNIVAHQGQSPGLITITGRKCEHPKQKRGKN